jgi:hypothetical protein
MPEIQNIFWKKKLKKYGSKTSAGSQRHVILRRARMAAKIAVSCSISKKNLFNSGAKEECGL